MVGVTKTILAKKDATYGTDSVPTASANAVVTRNFQTVPVENDQLARNLDVPAQGRQQTAPTNERATRSFEVELAGSGTAGTAPGWMELLEACGMAPAVLTASTKAEQRFCAAGVDCSSLTMYDWHVNQQRKMLGARGTWGFNFTAGQYPFLTFALTGLLPTGAPVGTSAPGTPDFTRWKAPLEVNRDNTDVLLCGYAVVMRSMTGEAGVGVTLRNLVNARYIRAGDHAITGRMQIEAPAVAVKDFYSAQRSGEHIPIAVQQGHTAGNIVELASANLQILSIGYQEDDGVLMLDIGYGLNVVAGQDDLLLTAR